MAHHNSIPANNLANASSPYLQQHALNPVKWFEWGPEALEKSKNENKPLLISIGYSACHWCHVMAHEVFENKEAAELLNEYFVCIKIDREERPDLDQIYMDALQLLTGKGGWPLNIFALPDGRPFHGGTYFSLDEWDRVVTQLNRLWLDEPSTLYEYAAKLTQGLKSTQNFKNTQSKWTENDFNTAINSIKNSWDIECGGFNRAPKFPLPVVYKFALHYVHLYGDSEVLNWIVLSLKRMSLGGLYDTVGGGYARYSVDAQWFAPHFEKMLYDNAQLLSLLAEVYTVTGDEFFKNKMAETHQFMLEAWLDDKGGLYSALDADSEGEEGKYYCYTWDELLKIGLPSEKVSEYFHLTRTGNWEHSKNILFATMTQEDFAKVESLNVEEFVEECKSFLSQLKSNRSKRIKPMLDDKILTSWNALAITGLLKCYQATAEEGYLSTAEKILKFIDNHLYSGNILYRSYKNKISSIPAFLEDYVFYAEALTQAYSLTFKENYLIKAKHLIEFVIQNFGQSANPFYIFNPDPKGELFIKKTDLGDDVIPSANSVLCELLLKHSFYFDKPEWRDMAKNMLETIRGQAMKAPAWYSNWLCAALLLHEGINQLTLVGESKLLNLGHYWPNTLMVAASPKIPLFAHKSKAKEGYYLCLDFDCYAPFNSMDDLQKQLF